MTKEEGVKLREIITIAFKKFELQLQQDLKFSSTLYGIVTAIDGLKYSVQVDEQVYTNIEISEDAFQFVGLNDLVLITVPNNNTNRMVITSKIKTSE